MTTRHLLAPDFRPLAELPGGELTADILPAMRAALETTFDALGEPATALEWFEAPGGPGSPPIRLLVARPQDSRGPCPCILFVHGGGMVVGSAWAFRHQVAAMAARHDAVVVSVDYRLAPETPFPGPQEDCYAALAWVFSNPDTLGIDPARIAIMGESAGGGLAAGLALMARDRGEFQPCAQILIHPMLDHRTGGSAAASDNPATGEFLWTRPQNRFGWNALRGDYTCDDERRGWFSPSLATDLAGLAQCYIATGALDLFFDENLNFAQRLVASHVATELHVYAGTPHGFMLAPQAATTLRIQRDIAEALDRLLALPAG